MQVQGSIRAPISEDIWKTQIPAKCKFHAWLMVRGKCLTADNLAKRGWPHNPICSLCHTTPETPAHLAVSCSFSQAVWTKIHSKLHLPLPATPTQQTQELATWWLDSLHGSSGPTRKARNSLIMLTWWLLWKERNARIFDSKASTSDVVASKIFDELLSWKQAGLSGVVAFRLPPD